MFALYHFEQIAYYLSNHSFTRSASPVLHLSLPSMGPAAGRSSIHCLEELGLFLSVNKLWHVKDILYQAIMSFVVMMTPEQASTAGKDL